MQDLELDLDTNDLKLSNGSFQLNTAYTAEEIIQRLQIKFKFFLGEWFLNINYGIPYFEDVLIIDPNFPVISGIFREAILNEPGIEELLEFSFDIIGNNTLVVQFKARANIDRGELQFSEAIDIFRD